MAVSGNFILFGHGIHRIVFHPSDKIDMVSGPATKQRIVIIASIIYDNGIGLKVQLASDGDIGGLALGDNGKSGEIAIMVQK
jgi:hypothetical protein